MDNLINNTSRLQGILETLANKGTSGTGQATPIIEVDSSTGLITATAGTKSATYQMTFQPAQIIVPNTATQIIAGETYLGGELIIRGDKNLKSENIKSGVSIFGVPGSLEMESLEEELAAQAELIEDIKSGLEGKTSGGGGNNNDLVKKMISRSEPLSITAADIQGIPNIGEYAFAYHNNLIDITIPDSATFIGNNAFDSCESLISVTIGNGVDSIGGYAFYGCSSLTSVTIPDSVTFIDYGAFYGCFNLTNVSISDNVTYISNSAFAECGSLTDIIIPDSVDTIASMTFMNCGGLINVTIGNSVTMIEDQAFYGCGSLTSISIPDAVTFIGSQAFSCCYSMIEYDFTSHTSVPILASNDAFEGILLECVIKVPTALYDEWIAATNWSDLADHIVAV